MTLIKYIKKEDAVGEIAAIYKTMEERLNILPNVLQFHTASPELYPKLMQVFGHFINHEKFSVKMLAYIRMLVSYHSKGEYCLRFQTSILKYLGETDSEIRASQEDYQQLNLEEKEKALVVFVLDIMTDKKIDRNEKIVELRSFGWTDKEIYELAFVGGLQKGMVSILNGFELEMDF